ncbi:MAG: HAMP domain-containing histidine kinase [Lachnospiraceae bacterium]|nr:HAMP domain-containing histidine kinase [Lachnospiraceae bacterium]
MSLKLRTKLLIIFFAVAILGFLGLTAMGALAYRQALSQTATSLHKEAVLIARSELIRRPNSQEALNLMASLNDADIWIVDVAGKVYASAGPTAAPEAIPGFSLTEQNTFYLTGTFFGTQPEGTLTVFAPITTDITLNGYVLIHCPASRLWQIVNQWQLFSYIIYGIMLLLLAVVLILESVFTVGAVQKTAKAGHEYANGNLNYPLTLRRRDEIGELAEIEKDLARQIGTASEDQKKFLANISHDFRSPLTSIKGYVTAIQDGTIPPESEGHYLDVVLSEVDRLTTLANGLLDLTQLEKGIILHRSDFDLRELVLEVLPAFEGRVEEKNLSFDVTFETETVPVNADRDRIGQVLHNLVDNAIKFSGDDSTIDIVAHLVGEKVFVSVRDHGIGIDKENLPKIWTRFYKIDQSRGKDKKGTGLGLSIVREIIQAHKENIDVISTPDVGTEFIFTLPSAEK